MAWSEDLAIIKDFGLLVLAVLPDLILEGSKSQVTLVIVGLMTLGLLVFSGGGLKNDLPVWDPNILTWDGLAIVILAFAIMQLTDMLGYYLLELQGVTTTENDASIIEF